MLTKFISVSETRFQNTETALKNQQVSIQGLKTQIGQLSKLISERPQGSLPSNTEPNPREQLNAINVQDEEGFVKPEPEPRQETVVSKDETITLQARNSGNTLEIEGVRLTRSTKTDNMVQPTLQEMSLKEAHESFESNSRGLIHEDRRLQIKELDEWRTHKSKTPDKPNLRQNKLNPFRNQLKVGDRVLLDATDPYIFATTSNEEIPLTVLSIFPFGTVEVSHSKFGTFKKRKRASSSAGPTTEIRHPLLKFPRGPQEELFQILWARPLSADRCIDWAAVEQVQLADAIQALLTTDPWELFFEIIEPTYLELTMEL
ncbi:hypothetical protein GOBAR_AA31695 [Gossypium barbadense]|uniref:Uncharacterized protein n=1 Tax=Gossypium barbadense TaxID=3634 RepID=A0A2P5WD23_GOSBA|nr:hypothetical protein GOBAR_AA31695 [Gossypium barbadense]